MGQLKLDNVRKSFGTSEVIKGVSLDVTHGEFVVFVGPLRMWQIYPASYDRRT